MMLTELSRSSITAYYNLCLTSAHLFNFTIALFHWYRLSKQCQLSNTNLLLQTLTIKSTGHAKKSNPLGKIRYLWNCSKFFLQINSA